MNKQLIQVLVLLLIYISSSIIYAEEGHKCSEQKSRDVKSVQSEKHQHQAKGQKEETRSKKDEQKDISNGFSERPKDGTEAICPVTKERFKITKDTPYSEYKGKYYYFCCDACKPQFEKDPEKYITYFTRTFLIRHR